MPPQAPTLAYPFRVVNGRTQVVEQDSDAELAQSVYVLLATEPGERAEEPSYGLADLAFTPTDADEDLEAIRAAVAEWEPRVGTLDVREFQVLLQETVKKIEVRATL